MSNNDTYGWYKSLTFRRLSSLPDTDPIVVHSERHAMIILLPASNSCSSECHRQSKPSRGFVELQLCQGQEGTLDSQGEPSFLYRAPFIA